MGTLKPRIEFIDQSNRILLAKYTPPNGENTLRKGSEIVVREGQSALTIVNGKIAEVLEPGTYILHDPDDKDRDTLQVVSRMMDKISADILYVNMRRFINLKWATKSPVMKRDAELGVVRIRSFGKLSFRVTRPKEFITEFCGVKRVYTTYDIMQYLSSVVAETFSEVVASSEIPVIDMSNNLKLLADEVSDKLSQVTQDWGVEISDILVEGLSLPESVEAAIDSRAGINVSKPDIDYLVKYNSAMAIPEAARTAAGAEVLKSTIGNNQSAHEKLRALKQLLDEGILTQEEFDAKKKNILENL